MNSSFRDNSSSDSSFRSGSLNKKGKIIATYLTDSGVGSLTKDDVSKLTHINYAFALINDGKVSDNHLKNIDKLNDMKSYNRSLKTLISIGGWGAGGFSEAAGSEQSRQTFSEAACRIVQKYDFDGVDIDWEYPCSSAANIKSSPNDKHNFTLMLTDIREKLNTLEKLTGKNYMLTIAVGAKKECINDIEIGAIKNTLDDINIMTYDLRGYQKITGHHTNLYSPDADNLELSGDSATHMLMSAGFPPDKIVLGAAFYGRLWSGVKNCCNGLNQEAETYGNITKSFSELSDQYINKNGFIRYWDKKCKAPYLYDGDSFISYDDEDSLKYKSEYIIKNNLAGIMFWEYSLDNTHKLVDTLYKSLNDIG